MDLETQHQLVTWAFVGLGVGLSALAAWAMAKLGITLSDRHKQLLNDAIATGLAWVEEQTHKGLEARGQEKMRLAEQTARSIAPKALASVSSEQFAVLAEAKLQSMRPWLPSKSLRPVPISFPPPPQLPSIPTPVPPARKK